MTGPRTDEHTRVDTEPGSGRTWTVRELAASPADVFAVLANGWLYPTWVVGASRMRDVDLGWPEPDTQLHHSFGVWPVLINDTTTILRWDPPRQVVLEARGWLLGTARIEIVATPHGTGSEVRVSENPNRGPALLIPKRVRDALIVVRNTETLRRLAFLAEGGAR